MPLIDPSIERVFLTSAYRHRSAEGILTAVAELALAAMCAYATSSLAATHRLALLLGVPLALVFASAAVMQLWAVTRNRIDRLRISENGIETAEGAWTWHQVREVFAEGWQDKPKIELKFVVTNEPLNNVKPFLLRPRLRPSDYDALTERLRGTVGRVHPALVLGRYHMPMTASG